MKFLKVCGFSLVTAVLFISPPTCWGQRLYDKDRDEQAQAARKLIENLQSGTLFDKQLKNLALLSKQDIETALFDGQSLMRARIGTFYTWKNVDARVTEIKQQMTIGDNLPSDAQREAMIKALKARIAEAKVELKNLQDEAACKKDPDKCDDAREGTLSTFFERVDDLKEYADYIQKLETPGVFTQSDVVVAKKILDTLEILKGTYQNYANRIAEYNKLVGTLMELRVPLKKVALQALAVEVEHWENVGRIRVRRAEEEGQIKILIADFEVYRGKIAFPGDENIEMSLRTLVTEARAAATALAAAEERGVGSNSTTSAAVPNSSTTRSRRSMHANARTRAIDNGASIPQLRQNFIDKRTKLGSVLTALHLAAAIAARGDLPTKLATLRLAQEEHAFSIRKSGVMARAYELTVSTGVQRLALYHQGGIKPTKVAELIHAAAAVAIPPILAVK